MSRLVYLSNKNVSEEIGIYIKLKCDCKTLKLNKIVFKNQAIYYYYNRINNEILMTKLKTVR
jgi:hypothetical protein